MANFLFSASGSVDKGRHKDGYPLLLADIVRGATDSIDALNLFRDLVIGRGNGPDTPGFMAFDPHVGETGCHLRAGMVNDIFSTYRCLSQTNSSAWQTVDNWLDETIIQLEGVVTGARAACLKLTKEKVKPNQLGFNTKQETPRKILLLLGWSEPEQSFSFATKDEKTAHAFEPLVSAASSLSLQNEKDIKSCLDRPAWDVFNSAILARFVVYAYVLSKYKAFSFHHGSLHGNLQAQAADDFTHKLMRDSWKIEGKRLGTRRLENEFRDLQVWFSELSCAWLQSLAKRSHLLCDMPSLISSITRRSRVGLAAVACYPGFLLEREFFLRQSTPLILVDKHFCTHGYHINVFEASVGFPSKPRVSGALSRLRDLFQCMLPIRSKPKSTTEGPQNNPGLGAALRWRLKRTSIDALLAEGDPTTPHVVVTGNSLRGSHQQYTDLVKASLSDSGSSRPANTLPHTGEKNGKPSSSRCSCAENEAHVAEFLRADHDRLARACFAAHCAYSFPLAAGENEVAFVEGAMDAWAGEKERVREGVTSPAAMWRASRAEADTLGTGTESMHLFRWQHVCSESKGRLGWLLERSLREAELVSLKGLLPGENDA